MGNKIAKKTKKFLAKKAKNPKQKSTSSGSAKSTSSGSAGGGKKVEKKKVENQKKKVEQENQIEESSSDQNLLESDDESIEDGAGFMMPGELEGFNDDQEEDEDDDDEMESGEDDEEEEEEEEEEDFDMGLDMKELQEKDPKFYQFLLENDKKLLEFDSQPVDGQQDNQQQQEEELVMEDEDDSLITREMIHKWRASVSKTLSFRTLKKIVSGLKAAAAFGDEEEENGLRYRVEDEKVHNLILLTAMKYSPIVLNQYLYGETELEATERKPLPSTLKKWKKLKATVKSFLLALLKILQKMTSLSMTKFVLKSTEASVTFFACFPKICKDFLKEMLKRWASAPQEQVKILSFLCIRRLALSAPNTYLDPVLKGAYQTFLSQARVVTQHSRVQIQFMENCMVELSGLFLASTYQHAFVALRQLAMKLRQASTTKTKESFSAVYNWQFVHALNVWGHVFCTYNKDQDPKMQLQPLVYPLVQIIIGAMRLKPSSKHFPLRLNLITLLIEITEKTGTFIPVSSYLFEVFESNELKSKPKPSTLKPLDFKCSIRAPNQYLGTKTYHTGLIDQVVSLLYYYYATQAKSIAFPELAIPAMIQIKRIIKASKDVAMSRHLQQLVEKLDQNSKYIEKERNSVTFGPKDLEKATAFLADVENSAVPIYKYYESRSKVLARQPTKDMFVATGEDTDDEEKTAIPAQTATQTKSKKAQITHSGNDDVVEDFELSSSDDDEM